MTIGVSPPILRAMARRIVALREARGWSRNHLARASGLTERAVAYLEAGEREPMASSAYKLAKALGTTVEYLWAGEV